MSSIKLPDSVVQQFIDEYWYGLGDMTKVKMENVFLNNSEFVTNPTVAIIDILRKPENFAYTCKLLLNVKLLPFQVIILQQLWNHTFPILTASRGASKSFTLAVYCLLKAIFQPGSKIVISGSSFRQAKIIFSYIETIWKNAPVLKSILSKEDRPSHDTDMYTFRIGESSITSIPLGAGGDKIRGLRASCLHPDTIIETEIGLMRIDDYQKYIEQNPCLFTGNDKVPLEKPSHFLITPKIDAYQVKLIGGYDFICSDFHRVLTTKGWKLGKDLTTDDSLVFKNNYKFPEKNIVIDDIELDEELAWLFGHILSNKYNVIAWKSSMYYNIDINNENLTKILKSFGVIIDNNKKIPWSILRSPKKVVLAFLSALMECHGVCSNKLNMRIVYYTDSIQLCNELQILLTKLGLFVVKGSIIDKLTKERKFFICLYKNKAIEFFNMLNVPKWYKLRNKYYLGTSEYNKNCLRVKKVEKLNEQLSLRDFTLPTTHSFYGNSFIQHNCLLVDEFNSVDVNIFEEVLRGFTSVSLNPYDSVLEQSKLLALKELGKISNEEFNNEILLSGHNQIIISGTCGFTFENLYKYWRKYHDIIMTGGDKAKLSHIFNGNIPDGLSWKDFCIIRLPYTLLPQAFMDEKSIGQAQATSSQAIFDSEYGVVFISDTDGFFKRTLIESCVCRNTTPPVSKPSCGILEFNASLKGEPDCEYILACDPAASRDNLAIVLLELHHDHRRVKYCWTINDKKHKLRIKYGLAAEHDYYRYCVRKMRDLMRVFKVKAIALDAQGGGKPLIEIFGDPSYLNVGEYPIYPIIEQDVDKLTDNLPGLHIIHAIQFSNADWVYDANHGLRQDMETRELIFPLKDSLAYGLAHEDDKIHNRIIIDEEHSEAEDLGDTLEDCLLEIEELKNELTLIEHSKTANGRDKWDTPQVKGLNNKKGRLLKDRYSALLMANALGRSLIARTVPENILSYGGTAQSFKSKQDKKHRDNYGIAVRRGGGRY